MNTKLRPPWPVAVDAVKSVILVLRFSYTFQCTLSASFLDTGDLLSLRSSAVWRPYLNAHLYSRIL